MRKNFLHYFYPSILKGVVSLFIVIPVSTFYLEPKDFGIIGIITVFSHLVAPFSSVAVGWVLGGNFYKISEDEKKNLIFNALVVGVMLRLFWVSLFASAGFYLLPKLIKAYQPIFLSFFLIFLVAELLNSIWEVVYYVIVLQKRGAIYAFLDITQLLGHTLVLVLCLVILHLKTISLALANLGSALGGFIFSMVYIRKYISWRFNLKWIKETLRFTLPIIPLNVFETISNSIDRFFIERLLNLSQLGIYTHSLGYRKMFMLPLKAFSKTYAPEVIEALSSGNQINDIGRSKIFFEKWIGLLGISGVGIVLFSREIINILTHGKFVQAAAIVPLWFILILVHSLGVPYTQFFFVHKKMKFVIISELILGLISWGMILLGVLHFGLIGATLAIILYYFTLNLLKKIYAVQQGCSNLEGKGLWIVLGTLLGLIILKTPLLPLPFKLGLFAIFSGLFFTIFDIDLYLKISSRH
jgi:O-antigen/teichoic acid export membrane protein